MHRNNLAAILRMVYDNAGISRKEIAVRTGLTPATVTNIVAELLREGYLVETGEGESGSGRKPVYLAVNKDRHCVVGIELAADNIVCVVADFCGEIIAKASAPNKSDNTPNQAMHIAWRLAGGLLAGASRAKETVLGLGLMTSGPYERESGVLIKPLGFSGEMWQRAPLRDMFQLMTGVPVVLDRDAVGCALAEAARMPKERGAVLAVTAGIIGIGGGILIGSEVFYGLNSAAGEIGHLTMLPNGPLCACGDHGCLDALSSGEAIAAAMSEARGRAVTVEEMITAYRTGDVEAVKAVRQGAQYLGMAVGNLIRCLSPACVAIGGRFIAKLPEYYDLVYEYALSRHDIHMEGGTRMIPFSYGEVQSAVGAVRLVIDGFYGALTE